MGDEVKTTDEPEAAHLRGVLRRVSAILDVLRGGETDAEARVREATAVVEQALARPRTNGRVIDELYDKIATLEGVSVDAKIDRELLQNARNDVVTLRLLNERLQREVSSLRGQLGAAVAVQSGAIDLADDARQFLAKLGEQLVFLAQHDAPLKLEIAQSWAMRLTAIAGKATT